MKFILIFFGLLSLCTFSKAIPPERTDLNLGFELDDVRQIKDPISILYRLPQNVVPIHYELEIRPILDPGYGERFTAPGKVTTRMNCTQATNLIVLHTLDTKINETTLRITRLEDDERINVSGPLEFNLTSQTVTIRLATPGLQANKEYELYIDFQSLIYQDREHGLYRTSYVDPANGETKYLCATDLEADDCRRIFPLFDEPAMKANWSVTVLRKRNYASLANNELDRTEPVPGETDWVKDIYKEIIPMSSYLLAFAVSDYTNFTANSTLFDGKPVTMWGPPPIMAEGGGIYAADTSALLLEFFQDTFNLTYVLNKMDKISLADFSAGAMENMGFNSYREARLMYIEGTSTIEDKVRMTTTLSHELAHHWFGNILTMTWWNDIWLNEGFATYMAALGIEQALKEYDYSPMEALLVNSIQPAMQVDGSANSHPISPDEELVQNETQIANLFSTIVYNKGASVIRMTNTFMGEDNMMNGLREYLKKFEYKNANQEDLFNNLQAAANVSYLPVGITMNVILRTWTKQYGYPIVKVERSPTTPNQITFTQEPFGKAGSGPLWWIPITYIRQTDTEIDTSTKVWLGTQSGFHTQTIPPSEWILVNPTQIGNYRVFYDDVNFSPLLAQLDGDDKMIDTMSKSAILDDYFTLAFAGHPGATLTQALDLSKFLFKERHFVPWVTFLTHQAQTYRMLGRSSVFLDYRRKMLGIIAPVLDDIKMDEQPGDTPGRQILLRTRLVDWSCNLGEERCITFAKGEFDKWMATADPVRNNMINPDMRSTIYCTAMANGGDKEWDFIVARYLDAQNATSSRYLPEQARNILVRALGCSKQSYRLAKLLDIALDHQNSFLLPIHRLTAIQTVAGNSAGVDLTFNFLRNNFDAIVRRFGLSTFLSSMNTLSTYLNKDLDKKDLETFASTKNELTTEPGKTSIATNLENIQKNIDWVINFQLELAEWLRK